MAQPHQESGRDSPPNRHLEWWHYVAIALALSQVIMYLILQQRPGIAGVIFWHLASDPILWWGVVGLLLLMACVQSLWRRPFWNRWRSGGFALLLILAVWPLTYRIYPSSYDERPSEVRFRLPLDGPITVGWGGATPDVNYHVVAPDQRWAYDLLVTQDDQTHRGDGSHCEDYYCYGLPVLAPADGVVTAIYDDARDMPIGAMGGMPAGGNQVVVEVAPNQYLFLCHLQPRSITVKVGERVAQGEPIAKVGNSGNTSEPHLHVHLQDTSEDTLGEGIPLYFHDYRVKGRVVERGLPTGGFDRLGNLIGQIVEHASANAVEQP